MFKFRARIENGTIVEGSLITKESTFLIGCYETSPPTMQDPCGDTYWIEYQVIPESLAISTGLTDKNGVEIFSSFPVNGVMSKGGDVIKKTGKLNHIFHWKRGKGKNIVSSNTHSVNGYATYSVILNLTTGIEYKLIESANEQKLNQNSIFFGLDLKPAIFEITGDTEIIGNQFDKEETK